MTTMLAYDLGTGGCKASLYDEAGRALASVFHAYDTHYPASGFHEQRPADWWQAVVASTRKLIDTSGADPASIRCLALSGQSLAVVPLDADGHLLREYVPIWSDTRPVEQARRFFEQVDQDEWYLATGNGFSRETYSAFKIMWYRDHEPDMFARLARIVGSKDYINFRLTGRIATDHSYASGSGVYNLKGRCYDERLLAASGLSADLWPPIFESTESLGTLTAEAAEALGLPRAVEVFCGGVDNSCMALGAGNVREGALYLSLGSSAWLAVSSAEPVVDLSIRPFVFAHVIPHMYTSATSIFSAGSTFRWLRDVVFDGYKARAEREGADAYDLLVAEAMRAPVGANGVFFNPSLAGGSAAYPNPRIRGAFLGLELRHTQSDLIRAVLEGITFDLCIMYRKLCGLVELEDLILMVGGGSNSSAWRQMFTDVFNTPFAKANVGQDAASLGAVALAAVGSGLWADFSVIDTIVEHQAITRPDPAAAAQYQTLLATYQKTWAYLSQLADLMGAES
ncbi:MAG: FGGY-family carbohydrate kinase [Anaerolineae bacterium]|nr:FGGY-family carbohydrate kinase [Anaerolineae bacterium]